MIRIGILGAGNMAQKHTQAWLDNNEVELAGVSWAGKQSLNKLHNKFAVPAVPDVDELLAQCDAVDVCLPTALHEEAVCRAAAAGRHVLCEKPLAPDLAAADRMIAACHDAGVILMAAHCLRFWPEYMYLKRAIDGGQYGRLLYLELERFSAVPTGSSKDWIPDTKRSGGPALDLHIHDADMALFLLGPPRSVFAKELDTHDCKVIQAHFDYGEVPLVNARGGWITSANYTFHMAYRAAFEHALVEYDSRNSPTINFMWPRGNPPKRFTQKTDGFRLQAKHFAACVTDGTPPDTSTGQDARQAVALVLAEQQSARTGLPVPFAD